MRIINLLAIEDLMGSVCYEQIFHLKHPSMQFREIDGKFGANMDVICKAWKGSSKSFV